MCHRSGLEKLEYKGMEVILTLVQ
ncbi:hypothetical protein A2U01_0102779, partial [Trifolium medium]|nr:hypothetical protein [Trifolium medium]